MTLQIASLNSGSNGNCYYVGNQADSVLIDAGLSCRETEKRMDNLGLSLSNVRGIFISHEHTDHTYGIEIIARRYEIPVYISPETRLAGKLRIDDALINPIGHGTGSVIGTLTVEAFRKRHDAIDPLSFTVSGNDLTVGVFTDIGSVCENLIRNFSRCHAAILESNYDEVLLEEGPYPPFLKARIRGDHGHLSNRQALELFRAHRPPFMTHLFLAHLSKDNNSPERAISYFRQHAMDMHLSVVSRYQESGLFTIDGMPNSHHSAGSVKQNDQPVQLTWL